MNNTNLNSSAPTYRTKLFRWFQHLYFCTNDTDNPILYYVKPEANESISIGTANWQKIMDNPADNYLFYKYRIHQNCTLEQISNPDSDGHVYLTEFSDLGDVAIKYNPTDKSLEYVGLAPKAIADAGTAPAITTDRNIDNSPSLADVLNYYDIEYTGSQYNLEMMYRQSAYHIKWLKEHNYKIIYLGARYSVGYDSGTDSYLFLMKDMIHL
jgi:hypothetical protein